jgi:hypothetical protein
MIIFSFIISYVIDLTHVVPEIYEEDLNRRLKEGNIKKIENQ